VRTLVVLVLVSAVACAQEPPAQAGEAEPAPNVVIILEAAVGAHVWPTARAELDEQHVALCPERISSPEGSDELHCDYVIGPLWVPDEYRVELRGDATGATVERTSDAIWVHSTWDDTRVSYRVDLRRGDPTTDVGSAVDTLRVECDGRRTTVLTPVVRTSPVGLRVAIDASDDVWGVEFHPVAAEHGSGIGGPVESVSFPLEPGTALVACLPDERSSYWDVEFGTFHLVDPEGLWMLSGVDCDETSSTESAEGRMDLPERMHPWEEFIARLETQLVGIGRHDFLRPTRYPALHGAKLHMWEGIVVRGGSRVATVKVDWDGRIQVEACTASDISAVG
jgi:hypothetical protein